MASIAPIKRYNFEKCLLHEISGNKIDKQQHYKVKDVKLQSSFMTRLVLLPILSRTLPTRSPTSSNVTYLYVTSLLFVFTSEHP